MADRVRLDDLAAGGDLDDVADDRELDLAALVRVADPVRGAGEAHSAGTVDLAGHRLPHRRLTRPPGMSSRGSGERGSLLVWRVALRVRGN